MTWSHCGEGGTGQPCPPEALGGSGGEGEGARLCLLSCPAVSSGSVSAWSVGRGQRLPEAGTPPAQELSTEGGPACPR